jgi:hypothetical protein
MREGAPWMARFGTVRTHIVLVEESGHAARRT